jgi:hypothetical protein
MPQATDPNQPKGRRPSVTPTARPTTPPRSRTSRTPPPGDPEIPVRPVDPRSRWIGVAAIGGAAVVAFVMTVGVFLPAIGALTSGGVVTEANPGALPAGILVCDREYAPAADPEELTLEEVRRRDGRDPTVVSAVPDAGCPTGVCIEGGLCLPVVHVRTASDRYIEYALQEGP